MAGRDRQVSWQGAACRRLGWAPETGFTAAALLDRLLHRVRIPPRYLHAVGAAALFIAAKIHEEDEVGHSCCFFVCGFFFFFFLFFLFFRFFSFFIFIFFVLRFFFIFLLLLLYPGFFSSLSFFFFILSFFLLCLSIFFCLLLLLIPLFFFSISYFFTFLSSSSSSSSFSYSSLASFLIPSLSSFMSSPVPHSPSPPSILPFLFFNSFFSFSFFFYVLPSFFLLLSDFQSSHVILVLYEDFIN